MYLPNGTTFAPPILLNQMTPCQLHKPHQRHTWISVATSLCPIHYPESQLLPWNNNTFAVTNWIRGALVLLKLKLITLGLLVISLWTLRAVPLLSPRLCLQVHPMCSIFSFQTKEAARGQRGNGMDVTRGRAKSPLSVGASRQGWEHTARASCKATVCSKQGSCPRPTSRGSLPEKQDRWAHCSIHG